MMWEPEQEHFDRSSAAGRDGIVYAIEKKEEAVALMRENQKKFAVG